MRRECAWMSTTRRCSAQGSRLIFWGLNLHENMGSQSWRSAACLGEVWLGMGMAGWEIGLHMGVMGGWKCRELANKQTRGVGEGGARDDPGPGSDHKSSYAGLDQQSSLQQQAAAVQRHSIAARHAQMLAL